MNRAQFAKAAKVLRENPPEIRVDTLRVVDGKECHCAIGKLAVAAGYSSEDVARWNFDLEPAFGIRSEEQCMVYMPNDRAHRQGCTPPEVAEAVITAMETLVRE